MEIGRWLPLDREGSRKDLWIEAYACSLQCVAEVATGRSWVTEGEGMVPQVSPLVQVFLMATGRHMSPHALHECWPPKHSIIPRQPSGQDPCCCNPMPGQRCQAKNHRTLHGTCLCGWTLIRTIGRRIVYPILQGDCGPKLQNAGNPASALHDKEGKYQGVARVLRFEGHMLVYDLQMNGARWIAMRGVPSSLTAVELQSCK